MLRTKAFILALFLLIGYSLADDILDMHGMKTMSMRSKYKQGTKDDFIEGVQRDESLMLNIKGKVGSLNVAANVYDSSVDLGNTNKNNIELKNDDWELYFGEYLAYLDKTEFTSFSKLQDGVKGVFRDHPFQYTVMKAESKGISAHDNLNGQNSQGPYKTTYKPIVVRSEHVTLRGRVLERDTDYTLDNELGELTFKHDFVQDSEMIYIDYEYSDSQYKKSFSAFRWEYVPTRDDEHYTLTYLSLTDTSPMSHTMIGLEGKYSLWPDTQMQTEIAYSSKQTETGMAFKQVLAFVTENTDINFTIKRVSDAFYALGNPAIRPGQSTALIDVSVMPLPDWRHHYFESDNTYVYQDGEVAEHIYDYHTNMSNLNVSAYRRSYTDFSNSLNMQETIQERVGANYRFRWGFLENAPGGRLEKMTDRFNVSGNYTNYIASLESSLTGLENVKLAMNVEYQERHLINDQTFNRQVYALSSELEPLDHYTFDGVAKFVKDSQEGDSALADVNYAFLFTKQVKVDGNINIETLRETINTTDYKVARVDEMVKVTLKPWSDIVLKYLVRPSFAELPEGIRYEDKVVKQYSLDYTMLSNMNHSVSFKQSTRRSLDRNQIPTVSLSLNENKDTWLVQSNIHFDEHDMTYSLELNKENTDRLMSTLTVNGYENYDAFQVIHNLDYGYQISDILKAGINYKNDYSRSLYSLDTSANIDQLTETVAINSEWQTNPALTLKLTASAAKATDFLGVNPVTYLLIPRVDVTFRPFKGCVLSSFVEKTSSMSGQETQKHRASLNVKYNLALIQLLECSFSSQVDYEKSMLPLSYETVDMLVKMTLVF